MSAPRAVVTFDDGKTVTFNPKRPRLLLDLEREFGVQAPETHEQMLWMAHRAVGDGKDFDAWVDTIEDVDLEEAEAPKDDPS
jgi:hypothetical protein